MVSTEGHIGWGRRWGGGMGFRAAMECGVSLDLRLYASSFSPAVGHQGDKMEMSSLEGGLSLAVTCWSEIGKWCSMGPRCPLTSRAL
jgi:hypothetical protein